MLRFKYIFFILSIIGPYTSSIIKILFQLIFLVLNIKCNNSITDKESKKEYWPIYLFITWGLICALRGLFVAENYVEYRQLFSGIIMLSIPLLVNLSCKPTIVSYLYSFWSKYWYVGCLIYFLFYGNIIVSLFPFLFLVSFWSFHKKRRAKQLLCIGFIFLIICGIDNRSLILKMTFSLFIGASPLLIYFLRFSFIKNIHKCCYLFVFVVFGFILENIPKIYSGEITSVKEILDNEGISMDTRSPLYIDVITSSIENQYMLYGRTPARGNDITISGPLFYWAYENGLDNKAFNKGERHFNEVLFLNIYTWTGILGLLLYSLIYFRATYLAVYKSNNVYIKIIGCYVAFHWSYGFLEDINDVDMLNIILWTYIGMCYSSRFRLMSCNDFKNWAKTLYK